MIDPDRMYTARSAAAATDLDERTIRRAVRVGDLPATRRGRLFVIAGGDLLAWLRARAAGDQATAATSTPPPDVISFERLYLAERQRSEDLAREAAVWRERATGAEERLAALVASTATPSPSVLPPSGILARLRRRRHRP
jgi:hypothetical protein